jgi:threonine dehydratase
MADTPTNTVPITIADVREAAARIKGAVVRTPTLLSQTLSAITGAEVYLKFENLQFTAAYKERGALNTLLQLGDNARKNGVIAASAGNHAQGLAYHGKRLGVPVTIVMPKTTPIVKVTQTESHGATVVLHGESFDDAYAHARLLEVERHLTFVHPFDQPSIMAGQGTIAREMLEDVPGLEMLVVPVGGGGLISGIAVAAKAINPDIKIIGVQPHEGSRIPGIRKWPEAYLPKIYDPANVDELIYVSQTDAEEMCRRMAREEGIFAGISAAGACWEAQQISARERDAVIAFIVCDRGDRYLSTGVFPA